MSVLQWNRCKLGVEESDLRRLYFIFLLLKSSSGVRIAERRSSRCHGASYSWCLKTYFSCEIKVI